MSKDKKIDDNIAFKSKITKTAPLVAFIIVVGTLIITVVQSCQEAKEHIQHTTQEALQEAIYANARRLAPPLSFSVCSTQQDKRGTYETKTFQSADTTFTYSSKIVDEETHILRSKQSFLLMQETLHSSDIQPIFDSLLHTKNIYANTTIGITASYYKKLNEWSKDTTNINIRLRTSFLKQGLFEDINYYAYTDYSCATLWKLMPMTSTLLLIITSLITGGIFIFYKTKEKRKTHKAIIVRPVLMDATVCEKTKTILYNGREVKFPSQMFKILSMFIEGEGRVKKKDIQKEIWPQHKDPLSNMTTAINELKGKLATENFTDTITSDPENNEYYQLVPS